ncbi:MAG: MmcB family DNA repair protein [Fusobacteriaceae bacterium]|jgi:hypothetical protein|nr:MmcB family DNA repair protein [Fusobacteriaceae bacterium]
MDNNDKVEKVTEYEITRALANMHYKTDIFAAQVRTNGINGKYRIFDGISIAKSWVSPCVKGYEIKTSRSDFQADNKYFEYLEFSDELYIVCPQNLIEKHEIHERIGLIWYNHKTKKLRTMKTAKYQRADPTKQNRILLYIIMSSINPTFPPPNFKVQHFKEWLDNKKTTKELSYLVKSKLISEISEYKKAGYENIVERLKRAETTYNSIYEVLRKHGLEYQGNPAQIVDDILSRGDGMLPWISRLKLCVKSLYSEIEKRE